MWPLTKFYRCSFCRERLRVVPFRESSLSARLTTVFGLREYACPHCFGRVGRPWLPIGFVVKPIVWAFHVLLPRKRVIKEAAIRRSRTEISPTASPTQQPSDAPSSAAKP